MFATAFRNDFTGRDRMARKRSGKSTFKLNPPPPNSIQRESEAITHKRWIAPYSLDVFYTAICTKGWGDDRVRCLSKITAPSLRQLIKQSAATNPPCFGRSDNCETEEQCLVDYLSSNFFRAEHISIATLNETLKELEELCHEIQAGLELNIMSSKIHTLRGRRKFAQIFYWFDQHHPEALGQHIDAIMEWDGVPIHKFDEMTHLLGAALILAIGPLKDFKPICCKLETCRKYLHPDSKATLFCSETCKITFNNQKRDNSTRAKAEQKNRQIRKAHANRKLRSRE